MKKEEQFEGFGIALTLAGAVFYCFNEDKTSIEDFVFLERSAIMKAGLKKYRLFKLYDTDYVGYTIVALN